MNIMNNYCYSWCRGPRSQTPHWGQV